MTQRVEVFFQYDAKNWTFLVFQYDSKNWTFFFFKMLKELNLSFIWITFLHDSNWTLFWSIRHKEYFFTKNDSKCWTPLNLTERVEPFFALDSKNWTFFQPYDSKNWAFFCRSQKLNFLTKKKKNPHLQKWLKELSPFETCLTELIFFETKKTHRIEPFFSLTEVNLVFNMTHSIEPFFSTWLKEWFFFDWLKKKLNRISGIWLKKLSPSVLEEWLKELNLVSKKKRLKGWNSLYRTHRIEPLFFLNFSIWLTELKSFFNMTQRIDFFWIDSKKMNRISRIWLKELGPNFLKNDSKNWTFF